MTSVTLRSADKEMFDGVEMQFPFGVVPEVMTLGRNKFIRTVTQAGVELWEEGYAPSSVHTQCEDCGKCRTSEREEWCVDCDYFGCENGPDCMDAKELAK